MASPWIFIAPSSRGIGHAVTRHLLRTTSLPILASTRSTSPSDTKASLLRDLPDADALAPRLSLVTCDVTDPSSLSAAADRARELFPARTHHLRLACAIPGVLHAEKRPEQIDPDLALETLKVNTLGPMLLIKYFAEMLPRKATEMEASPAGDAVRLPAHATWLSMSARVGSTSDNKAGGWYSYRASKAGVTSLAKTLDNYLYARSGDNALSVAYHPGTVKTGLSEGFWHSVAEGKLFSPEYAAERLVDLVAGLEVGQRGRFYDWKKEEVLP